MSSAELHCLDVDEERGCGEGNCTVLDMEVFNLIQCVCSRGYRNDLASGFPQPCIGIDFSLPIHSSFILKSILNYY